MRFWQQAASWQDFAALTRGMIGSEETLRRKFWRKILREAASLPFLEQLLTAVLPQLNESEEFNRLASTVLGEEIEQRKVLRVRCLEDTAT